MLALTPLEKSQPEKIIAVLTDRENSTLHIIGGRFEKTNLQFESFANEYPQTNYFECEFRKITDTFPKIIHGFVR